LPEAAWAPDDAAPDAFAALVAPLFEEAPRFIARLTDARPFGSWARLFEDAEAIALAMPEDEKVELIDAHPRIGAPPGSVSALSFVEQGYGAPDAGAAVATAETERLRVLVALDDLNERYEERFGFRFVVFVAGRPRAAIVPVLEAALGEDRDAEMDRALRDVVAIGRARAMATGLARPDELNAPSPAPEEEDR
jgi:2-oxo-4-hydroxy-4-carboxy--5-ureidoimidazoline (OHCU) decarboxylase